MDGSSCLKPVEQSILRSPRITLPRDGSDLVEKILDEEPTVCQVPGSALDRQLMEGITQLEHLALGVSLDSRPMEGSSFLEPVKQSILRSSQTERPRIGDRLVEGISDGEPTVCQVPGTALDSQLMEGITYLEHLALAVSLDSGPMEGSSCLEPVEQSIIISSWTVSPRNCVMEQKSEWKPVITPAISYTLDSRPMEGMTNLEGPAPGVALDSWPMEGVSCLRPLEQSVLNSSIAARPVEDVVREVSDRKPVINRASDVNSENLRMRISPDPVPLQQSVPRDSSELCYEQSHPDASDDMNTYLPESLTLMLIRCSCRRRNPKLSIKGRTIVIRIRTCRRVQLR